MMVQLQKDVPLVKATRVVPESRRKYPLNEMEVGDMFFVPNAKSTLPTYCAKMGKKLQVKFQTRTCYMRLDDKEEWQPCEPGDEGAVRGTGVWRGA